VCSSWLLCLVVSGCRKVAAFLPYPTTVSTALWSSYHEYQQSSYPLQVTSQELDSQDSIDEEQQKHTFALRCKELCDERNLPFAKIKNARDLATVRNSPIRPGRVFRMGRLSDASDSDIELLKRLDFRTLVDLRSPTELKEDPTLLREEVFTDFTDLVWKEQGRGKDGCLRELSKGENPVKKRFWTRQNPRDGSHEDATRSTQTVQAATSAGSISEEAAVGEEDELCTLDCDDPKSVPVSVYETDRKERHFVSVMNELKYVKGTVSKLRKRDITKTILKSPGAIVSKRVRNSVKKPFLDEINDGGLPMLNELLLRFGAPGIKYVLELISDRSRHPIAWYCAAGKDRTGVIAALVLSLCGVSDEDIVEDYALSANVYAEMNDHKAMVGALSQRNLNPKTFLGAPPHVMWDTLQAINETYGSVSGYCSWIGFGPEKQEKLRRACMDD
jgi:protein tyrosine/serine phosphatase